NYVGTTTDQGQGSTGLNMVVTSYDTAFFKTLGINASNFANIGAQAPFVQVAPSTAFNSPIAALGSAPTIGVTVGANNGTSGPDFLLQLNGTPQSFFVPEPSSLVMAVSALGIIPLAMRRV